MKNMKKFASVLVAIVLVLAMSVPTFAAEQTGSITINNVDAGDKFAAYKILDAEALDVADPSNGVSYSIPTEMQGFYVDYFSVDESDVFNVINAIKALDGESEKLQKFAKAALTWAKAKNVTAENVTVSTGETSATFTNIPYGYYVIEDTTDFPNDSENKVVSALMLDTTNSEPAINVKRDIPTVEKKVNDVNDSKGTDEGWKDTADHDIGDAVKFKLTGTVADNVGLYDTYSYTFVDTLSNGLTLNEESIKVYIDDKEVVTGYTKEVTGQTFKVIFNDLKSATVKTETGTETAIIAADTEVVVEYTATLNENAVIGKDGNTNKVYLEYSNNPNGEGTGKTPEDIVTVYTYELTVIKTDADSQPLEGAGFTLYKFDKGTNDWVEVGDEQLTKIVEDKALVNWKGLDDGQYKIVETTVPTGYNKANDVEFEIVASIDGEGEKLLTAGTLEVDVENGAISTTIVNKTGSLLPETGGMGTTMFYVLGGLLVVGAAILLVTKKRMAFEA